MSNSYILAQSNEFYWSVTISSQTIPVVYAIKNPKYLILGNASYLLLFFFLKSGILKEQFSLGTKIAIKCFKSNIWLKNIYQAMKAFSYLAHQFREDDSP